MYLSGKGQGGGCCTGRIAALQFVYRALCDLCHFRSPWQLCPQFPEKAAYGLGMARDSFVDMGCFVGPVFVVLLGRPWPAGWIAAV